MAHAAAPLTDDQDRLQETHARLNDAHAMLDVLALLLDDDRGGGGPGADLMLPGGARHGLSVLLDRIGDEIGSASDALDALDPAVHR